MKDPEEHRKKNNHKQLHRYRRLADFERLRIIEKVEHVYTKTKCNYWAAQQLKEGQHWYLQEQEEGEQRGESLSRGGEDTNTTNKKKTIKQKWVA